MRKNQKILDIVFFSYECSCKEVNQNEVTISWNLAKRATIYKYLKQISCSFSKNDVTSLFTLHSHSFATKKYN